MKKLIFILIIFVSLSKVSAQIEINSSGQVGVGTTNPQHRLDVSGDARITGNIFLGSTFNSLGTTGNIPLTFKVNDVLAGFTGRSGISNVSFGYGALNPLTGSANTAIGYNSLNSNTTGSSNTATGYQALFSNTTGSRNTATGYLALYSNTEGIYNTANGSSVLYANTTGNYNTANGNGALYSNMTGNYNTANGNGALYSNMTGNYNTAIGTSANVNAGDLTNATVIGYNAKATASNQVRIGNSSVTSIGGYAAWSNISDGRTKKNIRANVPGLAFIKLLQPVTYNLDLDAVDELLKSDDIRINDPGDSLRIEPSPAERAIEAKARASKEQQVNSGFIAQDVEKTAKSIGYDFSGVDVDENGVYGLRYSEFVVPLVKAVQELSEQNDRLSEQNAAKDAAIALLQKQVNELTVSVNRLMDKK